METLTLRPREIRYSQDSIECRFSNGTPLTCVFAHLINGSLKVTDLPRIEVLRMNGHWWTVTGNRRLFLYQKLEEVGVVEMISVRKSWISPTSDLFRKKFTNVCNGKKVSCGQKFLQLSLNKIVSEWKNGQDMVAKWDHFRQAVAVQYGYREDSDNDDYEVCERHDYDQSEGGLFDYDEDDDYCGQQNDCDDPEGQDDYYQDGNEEDQYQDVHYDEYDNADTYNDSIDACNDHIDEYDDHDHIDAHDDQINAQNDLIDACNDHTDSYDDHTDEYNDQIAAYCDQIDAEKDQLYAYDLIDRYNDQIDVYYDHMYDCEYEYEEYEMDNDYGYYDSEPDDYDDNDDCRYEYDEIYGGCNCGFDE